MKEMAETRVEFVLQEIHDRLVGEGCPFEAVEQQGPRMLKLTDFDGSVYVLELQKAPTVVFVPQPGAVERLGILPGTAIVGTRQGALLRIDFEGNRYGAVNLRRFEERVRCAHDRHVSGYPTTARMLVAHDDMAIVGFFDPEAGLLVVDREVLDEWNARQPGGDR